MGAYAALERTAVDMKSTQLADGHCRVLMGIHLDESEAAIGLEAGLGDVAEVGEERHQIVLSGVRGKIADIASRLPCRSLRHYHIIAAGTMSRKVMVTERCGRCHPHICHSLLLRN